jgi:segregation and condensation protein B
MDLSKERMLIETILYLEAEPLDLNILARLTGFSKDAVSLCLEEIKKHYQEGIHGMELSEIGGAFHFSPKLDLWPYLKDRYGKKNDSRLSRAAMETLSIIAYSQPITRGEIENIRGVASDNMIKLLLSKDFIKEVGKKDSPGKPVLYGTTREFLKTFRLSSIADLPKLDEVEKEKFELNG